MLPPTLLCTLESGSVRRRTQLLNKAVQASKQPHPASALPPLLPSCLALDRSLNRTHIHRLSHEVQQLQATLRVLRAPTSASERRESGFGLVQPGKDEFRVSNGIEILAEVSAALFTFATISLVPLTLILTEKSLHPLFRRTTAKNNSQKLDRHRRGGHVRFRRLSLLQPEKAETGIAWLARTPSHLK